MDIRDFQQLMLELYGSRDLQRGVNKTFMWIVEEVGELSKAILNNDNENIKEELADILAWLCSLANILEIDLEEAAQRKYPGKCIRCNSNPCKCPLK
ncbi:MAG: MazG nucleotide pyrophosphohydrolase domain-containing protein [Candidatus Odinarchaeia archaeon]